MDKDAGREKNSSNRAEEAECRLIKAKLRFIKSVSQYEPLAIVRRNPLVSLGCALMAGMTAGTLKGNAMALLLTQSALRMGMIAMRYILARNK